MTMPDSTEPQAFEESPEAAPVGFGAFLDHPRVIQDGRHERAVRTQRAVTQGMLDCLEAGDVNPTARDIARRAGVSVRAVFRHFDHLETLFAAVCELQYDRVLRSLRRVKAQGPLEGRVAAFVLQQSRLHERISPVRRGAQRYESVSPAVARCNERLRQRDRDEIGRIFADELAPLSPAARREAIRALAAAASWSHWEELRRCQHVAAPRARRFLEREIRAILAGT